MLTAIKEYWRSLKRGEPGSRFQDQHERSRQTASSMAGRVARVAGGILLCVAGLFFLPAPGPGFIIIALGGTLLAHESRAAAVALDYLEVRAQQAYEWARRRWRA